MTDKKILKFKLKINENKIERKPIKPTVSSLINEINKLLDRPSKKKRVETNYWYQKWKGVITKDTMEIKKDNQEVVGTRLCSQIQ